MMLYFSVPPMRLSTDNKKPQISFLSENCSSRYITLDWVYYNSRYLSIKLFVHPTYYTNHDHLM